MRVSRHASRVGRGLTALFLALVLLVSLPAVAGAQEVEDWDSVDNPAYDSAETDAANRDITDAQDDIEEAQEEQDNLVCTLCAASRELDEEMDAGYEDTREGVAELVDARAQAIEDAPGGSEEELNDKLDALDTLEDYAVEWGPSRSTGGLADTDEVEAAQEEVGEQLSAVAAEDSGSDEGENGGSTSSPEETTAPEQTAAGGAAGSGEEPAGGSDQGSDGGGSDDVGGPEDDGGGGGSGEDSGSNTGGGGLLFDPSIWTLIAAALLAVGVSYYVIGLLREGLGERAKRVGATQTARAPRPKSKPRPNGSKGGPEGGTRQCRAAGGEPDGPDREAPERPEKSSGKSPRDRSTKTEEPDDGSAIADRLKRMRGEDAEPRHPTAEELDDLFDLPDLEDDEDGEEER